MRCTRRSHIPAFLLWDELKDGMLGATAVTLCSEGKAKRTAEELTQGLDIELLDEPPWNFLPLNF